MNFGGTATVVRLLLILMCSEKKKERKKKPDTFWKGVMLMFICRKFRKKNCHALSLLTSYWLCIVAVFFCDLYSLLPWCKFYGWLGAPNDSSVHLGLHPDVHSSFSSFLWVGFLQGSRFIQNEDRTDDVQGSGLGDVLF